MLSHIQSHPGQACNREMNMIYQYYDFVNRSNLQRPRAGWMNEKERKKKRER